MRKVCYIEGMGRSEISSDLASCALRRASKQKLFCQEHSRSRLLFHSLQQGSEVRLQAVPAGSSYGNEPPEQAPGTSRLAAQNRGAGVLQRHQERMVLRSYFSCNWLCCEGCEMRIAGQALLKVLCRIFWEAFQVVTQG